MEGFVVKCLGIDLGLANVLGVISVSLWGSYIYLLWVNWRYGEGERNVGIKYMEVDHQ